MREVENQAEWDDLVCESAGHPLQLWAWGEAKSQSGRWVAHRLWLDGYGGAQVLVRRLPWPFNKLAYIPRGPVVNRAENRQRVLDALISWAKDQGALELKVEPDWVDATGLGAFRKSRNHILMARTLRIDLTKSEEELLAGLRRKTRYSVRKSQKSGVTIRKVEPDFAKNQADFETIMEIYNETANRAGFALHGTKYYADLIKFLGRANQIYLAERDGLPLAFTWTLRTPAVEFWLYGGNNQAGRDTEANYALNWQVILLSKAAGVKEYDMNGLLNDSVSTFKSGFAEEGTTLVGTYDKPLSPLYGLWERILPFGKKLVHLLKK